MERNSIKRKLNFDNSHLCGECNGDGCKRCNATGVTRWPLSQVINNVQPPAIEHHYALKYWLRRKYDPIGCDHKWPSGFSAWSFVSEGECAGLSNWKEHVVVCMKCGDIKISGKTVYNDGDTPKHQHPFEVSISIYHADNLAAMIRQAAYMNEMNVDQFLQEVRTQVTNQEHRDEVLLARPDIAETYPYKLSEVRNG